MPVLVDHALRSLVLDTLPVVKLTEWYGTPARDQVYTYARLCVAAGALHLAMTVFDGAPPATQRACARLHLNGKALRLTFGPDGSASATVDGVPATLPEGCCLFAAGADEQGWYWQAHAILDRALLQSWGIALPAPGDTFEGGFTLQDENEEAFGSAFAADAPDAALGNFLVISA